MSSIATVLFLAGLLVFASVLASKASTKIGVPALLLFLVIGMLAGSDGPGGIEFDDAGIARFIGVAALALILYSGGLDTNWSETRPIAVRGVLLSTVGVLVSTALVGGFAVLVVGLSLLEGLLLGAVVSSTDAAAVFSVLRSRNIHVGRKIRSLLEMESGVNDPMAVFLTLGLISLAMDPSTGWWELIPSFLMQMAVGGLVGFAFGKLIVFVINHVQLEHDGLYPVLSLSLVTMTYGVAVLLDGSGFLAVYVAGVILGNSVYIHKRSLTHFHDGLAWLMQIVMFLTFGLLVFPSQLPAVAGIGTVLALFLMFVARPVSVVACLLFSRFTWRARALVSWIGLRGAAPVILATFPLVAGVPRANDIFDIVFFVTLASVLVQGPTTPVVARWLGVSGSAFHPRPYEREETDASWLVEYVVPESSPIVGTQLAKTGLPETARALLVRRYGRYLVPTGGTRLRRDDALLLLVDDDAEATLDKRSDLERAPGPVAVCRIDVPPDPSASGASRPQAEARAPSIGGGGSPSEGPDVRQPDEEHEAEETQRS
ncbi:MAG TPA: potassium/proton antiporter [Thermoleophilia bacterium]|nr:potassium/proton antiporter [Thermoleophilia bacterium]